MTSKPKQEKNVDKAKVCSNLIMCDLYAFNPAICGSVNANQANTTYKELQVIETNNGIVEQLVEVPYPITAESVASYEQSTNYKNDVDGAISNGVKKINLGDVTAYQEALAMDSQLIADLASRLKSANELIKASTVPIETVNSTKETTNA